MNLRRLAAMVPLVQAWLARQCEAIPGATRGVVVLATPGGGEPGAAAQWPGGGAPNADLTAAANVAAARRCVVARERRAEPDSPAKHIQVASPFSCASGPTGAIAVEVADLDPGNAELIATLLRSGAVWLDVLARSDAARGRLAKVLEFVRTALEGDCFREAATAVATDLTTSLSCERVSLGFTQRGQMRVEGLSHSAMFDARSILVRDLGLAMDEACDQDATVVHPAPSEGPPRIERAHEELARQHGAHAVCTAPIARGGEIVGALTFERPEGAPFDAEAVQLCEDVAALAGPVLDLRRGTDARLVERARGFLRAQRVKLFGPDHPAFKLAALGVLGVLVLLLFAKAEHRITAEATLEGRVQRAIVAGFEGYIAEAHARAGDLVRKGQVLGRLDERDLRLEQRKWAARRAQLRKEYREAMAGHDRTQLMILSAKVAQADAQLELLREQFARTRLVAPFDGVIVKGDLSQALGSPVERGEVLFQLAPLEGYRVILKVEDRDISSIAVGHPGMLALSAMPGTPLPLTVERVTPVAVSVDGSNYFRVEARLEQRAGALRPGMEGIAKIGVGRRALIWIWTHNLLDWIRLWVWSWWP
jgi:RND family efflux transporter MFP subunit